MNILRTILNCLGIAILVNSYSITIPSGREECFIVSTKTGTPCSGSFEVITSSDLLPIRVTVHSPKKKQTPLFEAKFSGKGALDPNESEGSFSFVAEHDGDYSMCIANGIENGDGVVRLVAFNFRAHITGEQDYEYAGLETELAELREGLDMLKDHQSYMNQREDVHKEILESINTKVLSWTVMEAIILIAMAFWQISYISNFFETKRKL